MVTMHRQPPSVELIVRQGPWSGQRFSLTKPTIIIGREAGNDVVINHPGVSRRHASLTWDGRQFIIQDLGSVNGTFVNGVRLAAPRVLQPGDVIGLGPTVLLTFQAWPPVVSPVEPPAYVPPRPAAPLPAKRRGRGRVTLPLLVALLGLGCLAFTVAGVAIWSYGGQRRQAINSRPLVLIHAPLNRERIPVGQSILVSATARAASGVERVELWVDGAFVFAQEAPANETLPSLALIAPWEPGTQGKHVLLVRATSADGVDGQSSISVWVEEAAPAEHVVEEGETLESIAAEHGVSVDELLASNPDLDPEGLEPGDTVHVPGGRTGPGPVGGPPGGGAPPPPADELVPTPDDAAPGSLPDVLELSFGLEPHLAAPGSLPDLPELLFGLEPYIPVPAAAVEPVGVRVEALALATDAAYESLHCYVSMGLLDPQWYPDEDHDQSTQESFASLGGGAWDVAAHLAGDRAATVMWPGNQPIPFAVTCVGVSGADAVEVGRLEINVRPEAWDGVTRRAVSEDGVGSFVLDYRFSLGRPFGGGFPIILDPDMAPPTNLRIAGFELRWDYEPYEDQEEPIDGFRIYLNNTRQFIVPARTVGIAAPPGWSVDARSSWTNVPPEWFNPPCGDEYGITVTAYRDNPDDPADPYESRHSDPLVISGDDLEDCETNVFVTFETLRITRAEGRTEPIGPVFGGFMVHGQFRLFDGRCGEDCAGLRLEPGETYDVGWLLGRNSSRQFRLPLTPEGINMQFVINSSHRGGDTLLCAGGLRLSEDEAFLYESGSYFSRTFWSDQPDARCEVEYLIRPTMGSPAGEAGRYPPPLPNLKVTDFVVDRPSRQLRIEVLNDGGATWAAHDLTIGLERGSGELIGSFVWPELVLFPGDSTTIYNEMPVVPRPTDICVLLDPDNEVVETVDYGTWGRQPFCNPLPDLRIAGVNYDVSEERLRIAVENVGEVGMVIGDLQARIHLPDGGYLRPRHPFPRSNVGLGRWGTYVLEWPLPEERFASLRRTGYTVIIDPDNRITETDDTNNSYTVPGSTRIHLWWSGLSVTYYPIIDPLLGWLDNESSFDARVMAASEGFNRWIIDFHQPTCRIDPRDCERYVPGCLARAESVEFEVGGDEGVEVFVTGDLEANHGWWTEHHYLGSAWVYFTQYDLAAADICHPFGTEGVIFYRAEVYPDLYPGSLWETSFGICRLEE